MKKKRKVIRNTEKPVQKYRLWVQSAFALLSIAIGVRFYFFIRYLETDGTTAFVSRPPGVDGYLPISSMMSAYLFLKEGIIHNAHPAGLFIFLGIVLMSLIIGKAFCSWMCPIGFLSEYLGKFGEKMFGKIKLPRWIDYPLRSLKYLLLGFFVYSIFFLMTDAALKAFLDSPYNQVADIKMFYFFADISKTALIVITVLFLGSIFVRNFWCRYLCPYGALLGITGLLSPNKIQRNVDTCIDCAKCAKACPSFINVDKVKTVWSDECSSCLSCVDACPVADTLDVKSLINKRKLPKKKIAVAIVAVFMAVTGLGMITGHWQNDISKEEYLYHYEHMESYGHPTSTNDVQKFNRQAEGQ
ncbi:MAG: 4Fe-4S binding protein [Candidatus Marinimicrobia bacterium]|nr:4Fe-4S binding protein [Candidatus Neomarinimicrobiota bacterium]MCF7827515.1 4Fe-4S binding protein [Candidatus Neomarinimicrobiota bacterium]MCF7881623.1 4Fe-4S binding protein [Candidatus Neomarinimicrobiota bacterium]